MSLRSNFRLDDSDQHISSSINNTDNLMRLSNTTFGDWMSQLLTCCIFPDPDTWDGVGWGGVGAQKGDLTLCAEPSRLFVQFNFQVL